MPPTVLERHGPLSDLLMGACKEGQPSAQHTGKAVNRLHVAPSKAASNLPSATLPVHVPGSAPKVATFNDNLHDEEIALLVQRKMQRHRMKQRSRVQKACAR